MRSGVPGRAKRAPGVMSHHRVYDSGCHTSAREQHEKENQESRSYFYTTTSSSPSGLGNRNNHLRSLLSFFVLLVTWTSLLGAAFAQHLGDQQRSADSLEPAWKQPSILVLDTRPPPAVPYMHLLRRQDEEEATPTTSARPSKATLSTDPKATQTPFTVPKPFDTALSNNFTANCAVFFRTFLADEAFSKCHPFSLLLQTSSAMFDASKSSIDISMTLEATCDVNMTTCLGTMNHLARELIADNNCAVDYANDNPQVLQAYNGLIAYEPLYLASCLRDDEGSYCYANAVTNTSSITDSYPYYLPLGVPLPGGTRATCNSCLQDAMAIFSSFAGNLTQPVSQTYNGAAQQVGIACGTGFVNQTATPLKAAASTSAVPLTSTFALVLMLLLYLFQ